MRSSVFVTASKAVTTAVLGLILLSGCASAAPAAPEAVQSGALLAEHGLEAMDARAVIERLDTMPIAERPTDLFASVQTEALILSDGLGAEATLPLPADELYISIAPYATQTHDCYFHSLTTCVGELKNEELRLLVVDDSNGAVLVDDTTRSYDNGFVGVWLPRDITARVTIEHDGRSVTSTIGTSADDPTCVTTLQLT